MIVRRAELVFEQLPGREASDPFPGRDDLEVRVVRVPWGPRHPHVHRSMPEVIYVAGGRGLLWRDGRFDRLETGDCALIEPGVAHATLPDPGSSIELVCFFPRPGLRADTHELEDVTVDNSAGGDRKGERR